MTAAKWVLSTVNWSVVVIYFSQLSVASAATNSRRVLKYPLLQLLDEKKKKKITLLAELKNQTVTQKTPNPAKA